MKYLNSNFLTENVHLRSTPQNAKQAYNKIVCLCEQEERRDPRANRMYVKTFSKRMERLVKMYWAFRNREQEGEQKDA